MILPNVVAGIEVYTNTGSRPRDFLGSLGDDIVNGGTGADTLRGSNGNDTLGGGTGNDLLAGDYGDDRLDGGKGIDRMFGGDGSDTYIVDSVHDWIDDTGGTDDQVIASASIVSLWLSIEHVTLVGTAAINATANGLNNTLIGNAAANKLDGGAGADTMEGASGSDTYFVDNVGDQVIETTGGSAGGVDLVNSAVTYTLGNNLEKLTLIGSSDINGIGNSLNNTITGNGGANRLDGDAGNDTMAGGKGDDTYVVNTAGDVVSETVANKSGGGVDTVESSITFSLAKHANIENLTLTGGGGGISGTGNALNNAIIGNDGANKLDGGAGDDFLDGGAGNDSLIGGSGNDWLHGGAGLDSLNGGVGRDVFDYNLLSDAGDIITGFTKGSGGDILDLADLLDTFGDPLDPFGGGYLSFTQSGSNTLVWVDSDGGMSSATTLVTLLNVALTQADADNYLV